MKSIPDGMVTSLGRSRRAVLSTLVVAGISLAGASPLDARKGHRHKRKRRQRKVKSNAFGCVSVGAFCKRDTECCSGICSGKTGKKTCQAHDASTCTPSQDICFDNTAKCTTTTGLPGECMVTTGNGSFCGAIGFCTDCTRDAECAAIYGPGAACFVCVEGCGEHTPSGTSCIVSGKLVL